jgi:hypothetical protein
MKQTMIRVLLPILCLPMLLTGCKGRTTALVYYPESGKYYNSKNDVVYVQAESYYEAVSLRRDLPFAHIPNKQTDDEILYQIDGTDPSEMLSNEYFEIFHADGITLPALAEMNVNQIYIGSVIEGATMDLAVADITDATEIEALISLYQNGPFFHEQVRVVEGEIGARYRLRFMSAEYPAICYRLSYYEYTEDTLIYEQIESQESFNPTYQGVEVSYTDHNGKLYAVYNFGKNIVHDRVTGHCYPAGDMIAKYLLDIQ